jgi:hypothetical protein
MKGILMAVAALALAACSTVGQVGASRTIVAHETSDEVRCMADCLDDGSENCVSCAADCLDEGAAAHVASGE